MRRPESPRTRLSAVLLILLSGALAGCSMPIFAGMTAGEFTFFGSLFSTAATGKGLGEFAMDAATGRDCRIIEGLAREDRKVCEQKNSPALENDWKGLASLEGGTELPQGPPPKDITSRDGREG